ncbi:MAG: periplasmic heavy metal sensor [Rhodopseudomonas sp.]|nr:periplasmic heavy metal sensor [Rhodopseudomonas sp.]
MSEEAPKSAARSIGQKWLVISVASNLFLGGLLVGSWISPPWHGGPPPRPPLQMMVQEASGRVSPEGLEKLRNLADELEERFHRGMSKVGALRDHMREELVRDPFDIVAFTKALDDLNGAFVADRSAANKRFAEVIATLSLKDRKQLANVRFP